MYKALVNGVVNIRIASNQMPLAHMQSGKALVNVAHAVIGEALW